MGDIISARLVLFLSEHFTLTLEPMVCLINFGFNGKCQLNIVLCEFLDISGHISRRQNYLAQLFMW